MQPRQLQRFPFLIWFGVRNVLLVPKEGSPWCWQGDVLMGCPRGARGWVRMCPLRSRGSERCPGCVPPCRGPFLWVAPVAPGVGCPLQGCMEGTGRPNGVAVPPCPGNSCAPDRCRGDPASSGHVTGGDSTGCYLYSSLDRAICSVTPRQRPGVPGAVKPSLGTVRERGASSHKVLMPWAKAVPQGPLPCLSPALPAPPQVTPVGWPHGISQPPQLSPPGWGRPKGGH